MHVIREKRYNGRCTKSCKWHYMTLQCIYINTQRTSAMKSLESNYNVCLMNLFLQIPIISTRSIALAQWICWWNRFCHVEWSRHLCKNCSNLATNSSWWPLLSVRTPFYLNRSKWAIWARPGPRWGYAMLRPRYGFPNWIAVLSRNGDS